MKNGRILATAHGHYDMQPWNGVNGSGIEPVCDKVLVLVDKALAKVGSLHLPGDVHERQTLSSTTGVLIAVGPQAFTWNSDRTARWEGDRPTAGLRVVFTRYAGQEYTGADGEIYRVIQDTAIGGTMGSAISEPADYAIGGFIHSSPITEELADV